MGKHLSQQKNKALVNHASEIQWPVAFEPAIMAFSLSRQLLGLTPQHFGSLSSNLNLQYKEKDSFMFYSYI